MAFHLRTTAALISVLLMMTIFSHADGHGHGHGRGLSPRYYWHSCPQYDETVVTTVNDFFNNDPTIAPGLLRMLFHDCFVRGCDASVLLNSTDGTTIPERGAVANSRLHGFDVIDAIKQSFENGICPGVVSCADILNSATLAAISAMGGPSWRLRLGRKDGSISRASEVLLPSPFENTTTLLNKFADKGFSPREMVLLQGGGHSIGTATCSFFLNRLTNFSGTGLPDPTMNAAYVQTLLAQCNNNASVLANNDPVTPNVLDKKYFINLENGLGLFTSDQEFALDSRTSGDVNDFSNRHNRRFANEFSRAMYKLSEVDVLTRSQGNVRNNCALLN